MAVRRWAVYADETGVVNRNELMQAIEDGEAMLWRAGGVLTVLPQRVPTSLDGEMVTVACVLEWKDRTDARPQPEQASVPRATVPVPEEQPLEYVAPQPAPEPALVPAGGIPDGLDEATLLEEDLASVEGR